MGRTCKKGEGIFTFVLKKNLVRLLRVHALKTRKSINQVAQEGLEFYLRDKCHPDDLIILEESATEDDLKILDESATEDDLKILDESDTERTLDVLAVIVLKNDL